jgi:hypothetical protein
MHDALDFTARPRAGHHNKQQEINRCNFLYTRLVNLPFTLNNSALETTDSPFTKRERLATTELPALVGAAKKDWIEQKLKLIAATKKKF